MEITQRLILRLNVKEMLSSYSEVIFIALMTVISTCFQMVKTVSIKSILRLTVQEVLSFYSEVVFIVLITVINICFSYFKAECERETKLLFRSHLHSPHNSDQHLFF
jgi:hypothetical protein